VQPVQLDHKDLRALKELQALKEIREPLEQLVYKDLLEYKVYKETQDLWDLQV
jgi:hypothetical protein